MERLLKGLLVLVTCAAAVIAWQFNGFHRAASDPIMMPTVVSVGEKVPSEDSVIKDFHSMGLIAGETSVFRAACPVRDLSLSLMATTQPTEAMLSQAMARMKHLYDLGIRTDICFQDPQDDAEEPAKMRGVERSVAIERKAAQAVGITFVYRPMRNKGPDSLQTMSDQQVFDWVDSVSKEILADAKAGGVLFHCSAGHDRTGIVAAFMRMKYQHWPVDQAIDEMRRLGHNWPKYSDNGGVSSWHEQHLRAIANLLEATTTRP